MVAAWVLPSSRVDAATVQSPAIPAPNSPPAQLGPLKLVSPLAVWPDVALILLRHLQPAVVGAVRAQLHDIGQHPSGKQLQPRATTLPLQLQAATDCKAGSLFDYGLVPTPRQHVPRGAARHTLASVVAPQKQHCMLRPPSTQRMYGLTYALHAWQRTGPMAPKSATCARWLGEPSAHQRAAIMARNTKPASAADRHPGGTGAAVRMHSSWPHPFRCHPPLAELNTGALPHLHGVVPGVLQRHGVDDGHQRQRRPLQQVPALGQHVEGGAQEAGAARAAVADDDGRVGGRRDGVRVLPPRLKHLAWAGTHSTRAAICQWSGGACRWQPADTSPRQFTRPLNTRVPSSSCLPPTWVGIAYGSGRGICEGSILLAAGAAGAMPGAMPVGIGGRGCCGMPPGMGGAMPGCDMLPGIGGGLPGMPPIGGCWPGGTIPGMGGCPGMGACPGSMPGCCAACCCGKPGMGGRRPAHAGAIGAR